jgi:hypothetical protein
LFYGTANLKEEADTAKITIKMSVMEEKVEDKKKRRRKGTEDENEKMQKNTLLKGKICYSIVT